ncbi:MAG: hypothetical protein VKN33_01530 [Candidatus Sericytochromatia bacterium]|nr:hypothetical protein [Candidatus Sericytochromatia bacterium]
MISASVTAAIVAFLAMIGIAPAPWMIGGIWLVVKGAIVILGLLGANKLLQRTKNNREDTENAR